MKTLILNLVFIAILASSGLYLFNQPSQDSLYTEYLAWKTKYGKNTNSNQDSYRFSIFSQNYKFIQEFNAKQTGDLRLGINIFADLTNTEYVEKLSGGAKQEKIDQENIVKFKTGKLPDSIDWVSEGAVTPVSNQGNCNSSWAFTVKESLEGIYQIKTGKLVSLSAQQLVDCVESSRGCVDGFQLSTFDYTSKNGIQSEASYPYVSEISGDATPCTYNSDDIVFKNSGYNFVSYDLGLDGILQAIQNQPLSTIVDVRSQTFQFYSSGVLDQCYSQQLDHAMLLTGYDKSASTPYFTCKNSWGTGWGIQGYIKLAMMGDGTGTCGVESYVTYPTLEK